MCAVGTHAWAGLNDGRLRAALLAPAVPGQPAIGPVAIREWQAHDAGITDIVQCGSRVFSLAADGSIKGWSVDSPGDQDDALRWARVCSCSLRGTKLGCRLVRFIQGLHLDCPGEQEGGLGSAACDAGHCQGCCDP